MNRPSICQIVRTCKTVTDRWTVRVHSHARGLIFEGEYKEMPKPLRQCGVDYYWINQNAATVTIMIQSVGKHEVGAFVEVNK